MKHKIGNVLLWILSVFFLLAFFAYLPSAASVLYLIIGIGIMPIKIIRNLWNKIPLKQKFIKPLFIIILFLAAAVITPDKSSSTQSNVVVLKNPSNIETETTEALISETDVSETEAEEIGTQSTTETEEISTQSTTETEEISTQSTTETEMSTVVTEEKTEISQTDEITTASSENDNSNDGNSLAEQPENKDDETEQSSQEVSEPVIVQQSAEQQPTQETDAQFAVNAKNGKIHIVGACSATGNGDQAMTKPVYFNTYEEAEAYSVQIAPNQSKRQCGNCW